MAERQPQESCLKWPEIKINIYIYIYNIKKRDDAQEHLHAITKSGSSAVLSFVKFAGPASVTCVPFQPAASAAWPKLPIDAIIKRPKATTTAMVVVSALLWNINLPYDIIVTVDISRGER